MNKRPLFWAVMCFALGEVLYIVADKGEKISTTLVVLICLAVIYVRMNIKVYRIVIYSLMLVAGFARYEMEEESHPYYRLFGGEYVEVIEEYGNYTIEYLTGKDGILSQGDHAKKSGFEKCQNIIAIGIVDDIVKSDAGYNITIKLLHSITENTIIEKDYKIIVYGVADEFRLGDNVDVNGEIVAFASTGNPGEFDRLNYYKARGVVGYSFSTSICIEKKTGETRIWYKLKSKLYELRISLSRSLEQICDAESSALYSGILLGDKTNISDEKMLLYRMSGIAHIFAISGLHIGIVGGLLYKLLRKIGIGFLPAAACSMLTTFFYGIMTGFSFSTIRATVMLGLSLIGQVLGRRYDLLTGMGLSLGIMLIGCPYRILDGGLILSFGAVAGVVVSKYIVKLFENNNNFRKLQKKKSRWIYSILSGFIFSCVINLVTLPLIAYTYFQIPTYSVLLNMLIVPLMSVTVFCGLFGALVGMFNGFFGSIIIIPGVWSLKLYQWLCLVFQKFPMGIINTGKPDIMELVIYYMVFAALLICLNPTYVSNVRRWIQKKYKKWIPYMKLKKLGYMICGIAMAIGIVGITTIRISNMNERIVFLDVGQGDGVLIKTANGTNIVIDVGSTTNDSLGEYVACPALLSEGMSHIDYWFISHFDEDHISGLSYILDNEIDLGIEVDNIVVSHNILEQQEHMLLKKAKNKGINIIYMHKGDKITNDSFAIEALHPSSGFESDDKNEQSLVIDYRSDYVSILFTGDIGKQGIEAILKSKSISNNYDILKVPHHGSKYSCSIGFLNSVNAEIAIISCGYRNSYGHPHEDMIEGLKDLDCDVYRTDYMGAIIVNTVEP